MLRFRVRGADISQVTETLQPAPGHQRLDDRWAAMGRSAKPEGALAGRHAVGDALAGGAAPKLILLFCSPAYDITEVLSGVAEVAGDAPLIGCSTAGEIGTDGPGEHGVVALALGGAGAPNWCR